MAGSNKKPLSTSFFPSNQYTKNADLIRLVDFGTSLYYYHGAAITGRRQQLLSNILKIDIIAGVLDLDAYFDIERE